MGEKRGKYRSYNEPKKETRDYSRIFKSNTVSYNTATSNYISGKEMFSRVAAEPCRHFIGEKVTVWKRFDKETKIGETIEGRVIGIYPHFLLLDCGNYNASVTYKDLVLGGKVFV